MLYILGTSHAFATSPNPSSQSNAEAGEDQGYAKFLRALSSIPEWAAKLETALRSQGREIDRNKAKAQILPKVVEVQKNLSALDDLNTKIVEDLGSKPADVNRKKLIADLEVLEDKLFRIKNTFRELRTDVQIINVPDTTDIERIAEGLVVYRDAEVHGALQLLGYTRLDDTQHMVPIHWTRTPKIDGCLRKELCPKETMTI